MDGPSGIHTPQTAKSREREERIAAREREQRRLRDRSSRRRNAWPSAASSGVRAAAAPQVRYYRAGSRDPTFSDVWR